MIEVSVTTDAELIRTRARIRKALATGRVAASRIGREALNDPRFIYQMREGRRPRPATIQRINAYLDGLDAKGGSK